MTYSAGKYGQAGVFNGTSSVINTTLNVCSDYTSFSISMWVKLNTGENRVFGTTSNVSGNEFKFGSEQNGYFYYEWYNRILRGYIIYPTISTSIINNSTWHHISISFDGSTMIGYVDNVNVLSTSKGLNPATDTNTNTIGVDGISAYTNGSIDQVRIFNRALTSAEINTLYTEQATKYTADISALSLTNPPTKAFLNKPVTVSTATEANASRCIAQDEVLTKVSSTLAEFVGTNATSGLLTTGDSIQVDGTTDVVCSSVTETNVSVDNTATHDIFGDGSAVATYNLDGNANDLGGTYNGIATNIAYSAGKYGQGAVFNGSSSYIDLGSQMTNAYYSFSFWADWNGVNQWERILDFGESNGSSWQTLIARSGNTNQLCYRNGNNDIFSNNNCIINGELHHYAVVQNGGTIKFYRDGNLFSTTSTSETPQQHSRSHCYIGKSNWNEPFYKGRIDQMRIFNRALTQAEVTTLYNEQVPNYQYQCTIPVQSTAPTSAKVLDRSITTTEASDVYNSGTNNFTKTYNTISKQGRAFKYKIEADTGVEIDKITIPMNKLN